jgi:hypothetical protein
LRPMWRMPNTVSRNVAKSSNRWLPGRF